MSNSSLSLHVVSAEFPCGAAWLANALLELGVPIRQLWGFDTAGEWQHEGGRLFRYVATHLPWRQTLASLRPGRLFAFRSGLDVRFGHELPWQAAASDRVLLIVRDPRDALHSEYRRQRSNRLLADGLDFPQFTAQAFAYGPVAHRDLLWLHGQCWLDPPAGRRCRVLRFEDFKQAPQRCLAEVADWLGIAADVDTLDAAARASDVAHLLAVEAALAGADPAARRFNHRGLAYEWRERWPPDWHRCLGSHWSGQLSELDYPPLQSSIDLQPELDPDTFLSWRGLHEPGQRRRWRQRLFDWLPALHRSRSGAVSA